MRVPFPQTPAPNSVYHKSFLFFLLKQAKMLLFFFSNCFFTDYHRRVNTFCIFICNLTFLFTYTAQVFLCNILPFFSTFKIEFFVYFLLKYECFILYRLRICHLAATIFSFSVDYILTLSMASFIIQKI